MEKKEKPFKKQNIRRVEAEEDDRCMLDPGKTCDNCFRCLEQGMPAYAKISIDRVILNGEEQDAVTMTDDVFAQSNIPAGVPLLRVHPLTMPGYTGKRHIED